MGRSRSIQRGGPGARADKAIYASFAETARGVGVALAAVPCWLLMAAFLQSTSVQTAAFMVTPIVAVACGAMWAAFRTRRDGYPLLAAFMTTIAAFLAMMILYTAYMFLFFVPS